MIYYPKMDRIPSSYKTRYNLTRFKGVKTDNGETTLPCDYATAAYNCEFKNGKLKRCHNMGRAEVLTEDGPFDIIDDLTNTFDYIYVYNKTDENGVEQIYLVIVTIGGVPYYLHLDEFGGLDGWKYMVENVLLGDRMALNYRYGGNDVLLLGASESGLFMYDGGKQLIKLPNMCYVSDVCVHAERVFMVKPEDEHTLWFTDEKNPNNWNSDMTGFGYITMQKEDGPILKTVSFLNNLYIFRQCGIWKLSGYGDERDFALSKLFMATSRIYKDTIVCTGERIIFLTDDGIFSFDGYAMEKWSGEYDEIIKPAFKKKACAATADGSYYVAMECDFKDDRGDLDNAIKTGSNNTIFKLKDGHVDCVIRGVNIRRFASVNNFLIKGALFSTEQERFVLMQMDTVYHDVPEITMYWKSSNIDFGMPDKTKIIKSVGLKANCDVTCKINADGVVHTFTMPTEGGDRKTNLDIKGKNFIFSIESTALEAEFSSPYVEADIWRE